MVLFFAQRPIQTVAVLTSAYRFSTGTRYLSAKELSLRTKSLHSLTVVALAAGGLVVAAPAALAAPAAHHSGAHGIANAPDHILASGPFDQQSSNWAGYAKTGSGFTTASVSWTVPTASALSSRHGAG